MKNKLRTLCFVMGISLFSLMAIGSEEGETNDASSDNNTQTETENVSEDTSMSDSNADDPSINSNENAADGSANNLQNGTFTVDVASLNIRKGVGVSFDVIHTAKQGDVYTMTGNEGVADNGATWYEIILSNGETGWCNGKYGTIEELVKNDGETEDIMMPILVGCKLENAIEAASAYDVFENFEDDFGFGTYNKSLSNSGGLLLYITYETESKYIMCASITTNRLATASEQKEFVRSMSKVLCPPNDIDTVSGWVDKNLGNEAETEINGVTYELSLGPVGNILYNAGYHEWEIWSLQQDNSIIKNDFTDKGDAQTVLDADVGNQKGDEKVLEEKLDPFDAWDAMEAYGKSIYVYGFKLHWLTQQYAQTAQDENTWFLKAGCTIKNESGQKIETVCEAKVTGTSNDPEIIYFYVY